MIFFLPLEPLEERYTLNWYQYFQDYFRKEGIEHHWIPGESCYTKIQRGAFLDVAGTHVWKFSQLQKVSKLMFEDKIKDGDTIFLADIWTPGLESLAYMRDALKKDIKIVGCIFAGTYDEFDFTTKAGMGYWGRDLENSWFRILDKIFVATEFHKRLLLEHRDCNPKKLIVTGHPIFTQRETIKFQDKENIVVFPHRLDSEKNPQLFDELAKEIKVTGCNWKFIKTIDVCKTKQEYYNLLRKAKIAVSFADQETLGFAMIEATFAGCYPVVPDRLSYKELYHSCFKYNSYSEAVCLVLRYMYEGNTDFYQREQDINSVELMNHGANAIPNMMKEILIK
jgi:glycosyltransferase involved in cell wall biosynthesis